jgi:hypothetical protein
MTSGTPCERRSTSSRSTHSVTRNGLLRVGYQKTSRRRSTHPTRRARCSTIQELSSGVYPVELDDVEPPRAGEHSIRTLSSG